MEHGATAFHGPRATERYDEAVERGLARLVANGALEPAQAKAAQAAIQDEMQRQVSTPWGGSGTRAGHGRPAPVDRAGTARRPAGFLLEGIETAATTIGVDARELREALAAGVSVADVAEAHGVSSRTVVDALVSAGEDHLASALTDGRLSPGQGDRMREGLMRMAERLVTHTFAPHDTAKRLGV